MRLRDPRVWVSLVSASGVLWFVFGDLGRTAPGPLSAVHARVPELTGFRSCARCHGGWTSNMVESCLECHEDIGDQLERPHGLHGTFGADRGRQCALCHSEHNGASFVMVNDRSFAVAGFASIAAFDHSRVGFDMKGRHSELECQTCHENAGLPVLPEGGKRFLGLEKDCATCHEDPHDGHMVRSCADCHVQKSFGEPRARNHERHLALTGGHAALGCRDCHARDETHALERLADRRKPEPRQCTDCHEPPHSTPFLDAVAEKVGQPRGRACAACHTAEQTEFRSETLLVPPGLHAASGFALDAPHDKAACNGCHGDPNDGYDVRYRGRRADDCSACHEDAHEGQFGYAGSPFAERGCIACHDHEHFEPHAFTLEKHRQTAFPLTGKHADQDCEECHRRPAPDGARRFHGTPRQCDRCHTDAHDGFFARFAAELGKDGDGTCGACHRTSGFSHLPEGGFDHTRFANFPIRGAHAQVDCEACHERSAQADSHGRTFGRVAKLHEDLHGKPDAARAARRPRCASCHRDPHLGEFDGKGRPATVEGRAGCGRCHSHISFRTFDHRFDHGTWTGFVLTGAHAKAECAACHAPLHHPDEHGRTWSRARGGACADCHEDPHQGQFTPPATRGAAPPRADCARCHRASERFADLSFNHEIHSRFPLGDRHKRVACAKCHKPIEARGKQFVRYRPLPRDCSACHGKQQGPFRRR